MSLRWQLQANEHHVVVQLCTEFRTWLREDGAITNHGQTNMSLPQPARESGPGADHVRTAVSFVTGRFVN
jgi:hypothetical protein